MLDCRYGLTISIIRPPANQSYRIASVPKETKKRLDRNADLSRPAYYKIISEDYQSKKYGDWIVNKAKKEKGGAGEKAQWPNSWEVKKPES